MIEIPLIDRPISPDNLPNAHLLKKEILWRCYCGKKLKREILDHLIPYKSKTTTPLVPINGVNDKTNRCSSPSL